MPNDDPKERKTRRNFLTLSAAITVLSGMTGTMVGVLTNIPDVPLPSDPDENTIHEKAVAAVEEAAKAKPLTPREIIDLYRVKAQLQEKQIEDQRDTPVNTPNPLLTKSAGVGAGIGLLGGVASGTAVSNHLSKVLKSRQAANTAIAADVKLLG